MKYLKTAIVLFVFSLAFFLTSLNYIHNKMKEELPTYYKLTEKMYLLNDTYSMCAGLLSTNPTKLNIDSCNLVFKEIELTVNNIEDNCPYISFYTKYIKSE